MADPDKADKQSVNERILDAFTPEGNVPDFGVVVTSSFNMESGNRQMGLRALGKADEVQLVGLLVKAAFAAMNLDEQEWGN